MKRRAEGLLLTLGTLLILAGAAGLIGIPVIAREIGLLPASLLILFGLLVSLAPNFQRIVFRHKNLTIVIDREIYAERSSKGFDDIREG